MIHALQRMAAPRNCVVLVRSQFRLEFDEQGVIYLPNAFCAVDIEFRILKPLSKDLLHDIFAA